MITEETAPIGTLVVPSREALEVGIFELKVGDVWVVVNWKQKWEGDSDVPEDRIVRVRLGGGPDVRSFYAWRFSLAKELKAPREFPKCLNCGLELCPEVDAYYGHRASLGQVCRPCRLKDFEETR